MVSMHIYINLSSTTLPIIGNLFVLLMQNPLWFPDFENRLKLAARQIIQFRHMTARPELADFLAIDILTTLEKLSASMELLT